MRAKRGTVCEAFAWIGQAFDVCDDCGHPFWEHTHERGLGELAGTSRRITPEDAGRARVRWFGETRPECRCECYDDNPGTRALNPRVRGYARIDEIP